MWDVVVIGAGLSGLAAARSLNQSGYAVLVLDKSRGVGGRLASRRVKDTVLDHGCPLLQPLGPYQSDLIEQGVAAGLLHPWSPAVYDLRANQLQRRPSRHPYYTAEAGLNALAKLLATGLEIQKQAQVSQITPLGQGWQLELMAPGLEPLTTRCLVMALPAPQISPLISPLQASLEGIKDLQTQLQQVRFRPIITAIAGYPPHPPTPDPGPGWMIWSEDPNDLACIILDSSKRPQPAEPVVVIHSQADFARAHLDHSDLSGVGTQLLTQAGQLVAAWIAAPQWLQVHRWRYGQVSHPLAAALLKTEKLPALVGCGDWCGGDWGEHTGVEAAIASGHQAASWITTVLG